MDITIIDCTTGDVVTRPMNEDELAQRALDEQAAIEQAAAAQAAAQAQAAATAAAIAHAKSLGFTDEMIAVMYPNLAP